ncbi:MAG: carbohydrate ABC transporter permease [Verrucomicrobia bacterium]|nr:carbohydrate ABC transporter permease [Verrucomicrobiota bacterium]
MNGRIDNVSAYSGAENLYRAKVSVAKAASVGLWYALATLLALVFAVPFIWMLTSALKPASEIFVNPPTPFSSHYTLSNFTRVFQQAPFGRYLLNSFIVSVAVTAAGLVCHSMSGYALARLDFPGRNLVFVGILSTLMVPFYTILIPLAILVRQLGWINTYWALIIPAIPHAFGIFWLRQFFLGIPRDLEDAARIDGATRIGIFLHIALPLARPILAALAVFFFLANWDAFLWPLIATSRPEMRVVQVGIQTYTGEHGNAWELIMAASVVAILPTLILFFILQRFIVASARMAGLKG